MHRGGIWINRRGERIEEGSGQHLLGNCQVVVNRMDIDADEMQIESAVRERTERKLAASRQRGHDFGEPVRVDKASDVIGPDWLLAIGNRRTTGEPDGHFAMVAAAAFFVEGLKVVSMARRQRNVT